MGEGNMRRLVKVSAFAQFAAGKASMVSQTAQLTMLLMLTFGLPFGLAVGMVAGCAFLAIAIVYFSGWARAESTYNTELNQIAARLDRIEAKL
jgi:hypothetical protein